MKRKTAFFIQAGCFLCEDYGLRGFYTCTNGKVVIMCDECRIIWRNPYDITPESATCASAPDWEIEPGCSIGGGQWSSKDEVVAAGYADLIAGSATPLS